MSEKVQLIERLMSLAERLIYTPQAQQETPEEKRVKVAVDAVKSLADVAIKLQEHDKALAALAEKLDDEFGKLKALATIAIIASIAAIVLAVLLP